ncbi:hypothetical protein QE431_003274 [Flavobacterium sp. SORGH_AS 622]|nr:hypothetical protein [Flavobacterium sp. SORGH_AS_0622]
MKNSNQNMKNYYSCSMMCCDAVMNLIDLAYI